MIKGLVLAGTFREYVTWLHDNIYNRSNYPFLGSEDEDVNRILTTDPKTPIYLVGHYRDRHTMLKLVRERFKDLRTDTIPLGFNANPDKYREPEPEDEVYESD